MKGKRYSVEQSVAAGKQHDMDLPAGDIARQRHRLEGAVAMMCDAGDGQEAFSLDA